MYEYVLKGLFLANTCFQHIHGEGALDEMSDWLYSCKQKVKDGTNAKDVRAILEGLRPLYCVDENEGEYKVDF